MTHIRPAKKKDAPFIFEMIQLLASYEKAADRVDITKDQLIKDGFGEHPLFESIILELDSKPVGMALFYNRYSTWKGKSLYLEDLFIIPEARGKKLGIMAMQYLAKYAVDTNCFRFEWQVIDWNVPSINFYKSINTDLDSEWINCRLEGDGINKLASKQI